MEVIATATLWGLFSAWMLFPLMGVPRMLARAAGALVWAEFVGLLVWGFASEDCQTRPCSALAEAARTAVSQDVPALGTVLVALAVADGARRLRRTQRVRR
jgi:hypothetical protein